MKKSLIALAVASAFAAPAFAATGNVDVYGKLRVSLSYVNPDDGSSFWGVGDEVSRIGFKGSEDLGGGMKAIWQIEQGLGGSAMGGVGTGSLASRNTFVGLAGGFGTVVMGRHDTPYKLAGSADLFGDTLADAQGSAGIIGYQGGAVSFDYRAPNALAYISPDFSGFHAAVAIIPGEDLTDAYSLAGIYNNGPLKATLAYEDHNNIADESAWKLNVGYTMGDLVLGATYENQDYGDNYDAWLVSAAYNMGPITLAGQYGDREIGDLKRFTLGMIYSLSKRTNVAVAYNNDDADGSAHDADAITFQVNHDF